MENGIEQQVILMNCQAMGCLDRPKKAIRLLQDAESLLLSDEKEIAELPNRLSLLAVTFNNLACYYKSARQPNVALFYLNQTLKLEMESFAEPSSLASTNLNICAIYSSLKKHKAAITHALSAIKYLKGYENEDEMNENIVNSLIVAHYNLGVEYEYLQKYSKSIENYAKGLKIATEYLGPDHTMVDKISESLKIVKEHSASLNSFIETRREKRTYGKYSSQSMEPIKASLNPDSVYKHKECSTRLPRIFKKVNRSIDEGEIFLEKDKRMSVEHSPRDIEGRNFLIKSNRTSKFTNAIDRLKLLIN